MNYHKNSKSTRILFNHQNFHEDDQEYLSIYTYIFYFFVICVSYHRHLWCVCHAWSLQDLSSQMIDSSVSFDIESKNFNVDILTLSNGNTMNCDLMGQKKEKMTWNGSRDMSLTTRWRIERCQRSVTDRTYDLSEEAKHMTRKFQFLSCSVRYTSFHFLQTYTWDTTNKTHDENFQ